MSSLPVEIVRSPRRTKTVQARLVSGRLRVMVPDLMSEEEARRWADEMASRLSRKRAARTTDLAGRARRLSERHGLPMPSSIEWSERQKQRWGSCSPSSGRVRISSRLAGMPDWVLEYVIVHELAHLEQPDHGPGFEALVSRYPLAERARGYLIAKGEE